MIEIERQHLGVMMEAGYIYMGMKRFKEARALFEGLSVIAPESDIPLVALGNVDFCEGKITKAMRHYTQAIKLDPNSAFARVYMGEALLFSGKKGEAMEWLRAVAKKDRGGAGDFARALIDAVKEGFSPSPGIKEH